MAVSLYRYNAVLPDDKDKFQENKTNQIMTGSGSSVTAASDFEADVLSKDVKGCIDCKNTELLRFVQH